jgi:hypothetical protein
MIMEKISVVNPAGLPAVKGSPLAPRLADLNGKTIAEVWNGVFKGDVVFPLVRKALRRRYPGVRIIPYTAFHHLPGSDVPSEQRALVAEILAQVRTKGVQAIITGMGA